LFLHLFLYFEIDAEASPHASTALFFVTASDHEVRELLVLLKGWTGLAVELQGSYRTFAAWQPPELYTHTFPNLSHRVQWKEFIINMRCVDSL
jgi:hypothetical protein